MQSTEKVARPERLELPTLWFEARCSIQLSYGRVVGKSTIWWGWGKVNRWEGAKRGSSTAQADRSQERTERKNRPAALGMTGLKVVLYVGAKSSDPLGKEFFPQAGGAGERREEPAAMPALPTKAPTGIP
jgi:hypothetical protein